MSGQPTQFLKIPVTEVTDEAHRSIYAQIKRLKD